jgi:hypothetical protein
VFSINYLGYFRRIKVIPSLTNKNRAFAGLEVLNAQCIAFFNCFCFKYALPIIEQFTEKEQKRLYNIHYTEIGKAYLKQKQLKKAMHWAFKTSNPAKALFLFVKDGMTFILRK